MNSLSTESHYAGAIIHGNYIWTAAMNLCWTELSEKIFKAPINLRTQDLSTLLMMKQFNHPVICKDDLDSSSYFVKSGFGQKAVDEINEECRMKFPGKTFQDLQIELGLNDLISYAYFLKKVEYLRAFTKQTVLFNQTRVKGFAAQKEEKEQIEVLDYNSADQFIIRLNLKQRDEELILAKGYPTQEPTEVLEKLNNVSIQSVSRLEDDEHFQMPVLSLEIQRDYFEMTGKPFVNPGFEDFQIGVMFENIAFDLDEKGARVESQAVITIERSASIKQKPDRFFYLDKPFWLILRRRNSNKPYFLLGVNETNIMQSI